MFVLYEEDGAFKAGTILTDNQATLQVENTHGKRVKLKRANVLLDFREPGPADLLSRAEAAAEELDTEFLWEVCGDDEFAFADFAAEYQGHPPTAVESAAILLRLHSAPIWFHRKGKGRFRKAPADILQAALAGLEKKRQQAAAIEHMRSELVDGRLPPELAALLPQALYRPDRNRNEVKALEAACVDTGLSAARLLLKCGALGSSYDFHYNRFLFEHFPEGADFPGFAPAALPPDLPRADVAAFSIDDASTTEIDDAFSIVPRAEGGWRIGIHIAAPALGFSRGTELDAIARRRLSTVYMPGGKITMLPDEVVQAFTLSEGRDCPAVSLYLDISPGLAIVGEESRVEMVPIVANLRHHDLEPLFNDETVHGDGPDFRWKHELTLLWDLATVLEAGRGKAGGNEDRIDFGFSVDWARDTADGPGFVSIARRLRGSPMDKLVAELMIHANVTWGRLLDEAGVPGLYRAQGGGKVRMTTVAAPHEGLGVECYAWSSSPLRRYVDLVNQWQIISVLQDTTPAFAPKSADLMAALRDFELTYAEYAEFQRGMERYWCLRWLRQHGRGEVEGTVLRENVVRLSEIPLVFKVPSMPLQLPGSRVRLAVEHTDLLDIEVEAHFLRTLSEPAQRDESQAADAFGPL
ncbi:ribonuclease catalytic domain-containing protein [Thauera linaloolentis]|uniref:Ribonuclease II n=1 Tax=Thauera linaloolentis (strain DSM 12138 / JCM 21573 / CCUG 41526 / CIP 105981 / IAM 15112 / NBRC 102519 / 47Lol) TaxID=1123367 RepID=N6YD41_THAL4|nr:RNB domain-containing ribonuclease [Thauera linaloolentis]ENO89420.1 ribonuclease II [Thauera linaloolentis 47Lol = DSM 12138]MCM8564356.1 RNB domain-containing ribonuclease [Thauera linaloolentis]